MRPNISGIFLSIVVLKSLPSAAYFPPHISSLLHEASTGKWHNAKQQDLVVFVCSTVTSTFMRNLSTAAQISSSQEWHETLVKIASRKQDALTLAVDLTCPEVDALLFQAGKEKLLKIPNRWMLINVSDSAANGEPFLDNTTKEITSCRDLAVSLGQRGPGFGGTTATDADVTVACAAAGGTVAMVDMWRATPLGSWNPSPEGFIGDRRPPSVRRLAAGLGGRDFPVALLITRNDSLGHLDDGSEVKYDSVTNINFEVISNVANMLNGRLKVLPTDTFGYMANGSYTGIIGLHARGEIEMSATSLAMLHSRLPLVKHTNFAMPTDVTFIFRAPPMSYERNIFIQPFPRSLWLASVAIVVLCATMLYGTLKVEELAGVAGRPSGIPAYILLEGRKRQLEASWSDVAILAFGAVCQQGSPVEARSLTGRIITMFLLLGILFLYTSYAASIVALLQSTATTIRSYKDMLHTKIALGAEDQIYNKYYMEHFEDLSRQELYEKKIKGNFLTLEEGTRRVRTSYFAFHTIRALIYKEIADTFTENEKCGLVEVGNYLLLANPMPTISMSSENTELILIALRKNQERGIRHRQIQQFLSRKPQCVNSGGNFQSVALIDCEAAFAVLGMGHGLSAAFLLMEHLAFRYRKALTALKKVVQNLPCPDALTPRSRLDSLAD